MGRYVYREENDTSWIVEILWFFIGILMWVFVELLFGFLHFVFDYTLDTIIELKDNFDILLERKTLFPTNYKTTYRRPEKKLFNPLKNWIINDIFNGMIILYFLPFIIAFLLPEDIRIMLEGSMINNIYVIYYPITLLFEFNGFWGTLFALLSFLFILFIIPFLTFRYFYYRFNSLWNKRNIEARWFDGEILFEIIIFILSPILVLLSYLRKE